LGCAFDADTHIIRSSRCSRDGARTFGRSLNM
jgi:hypothetical protein